MIAWQARGRWTAAVAASSASEPDDATPAGSLASRQGPCGGRHRAGCFLFAPWPREVVAFTGAGVLLLSRKMHSTRMLGLVDWELLVLFIGLFVVNHALQRTGLPAVVVADLAAAGWRLDDPALLGGAAFALSNVVSNVPAVMLLLPVATHPLAGPTLALVSTFAGNLLIVGSIANIIVVDAAARRGVRIDWRLHARTGVPVTLLTPAIAAGCLAAQAP